MLTILKRNKRILVAPLDWGLGHATRCIPIIRALISEGHEVFLAGDGNVQALLQQEFSQLPFLFLKGYRVRYSKASWALPGVLLFQIPKILQTIRYERRWLGKAIEEHHFDIVISDNRYGLYHKSIHSVFITHQLSIKAPFRLLENLLQKINYHFINCFNECWIPDNKDEPHLAGALSHPAKKPKIPVTYIGPLSRFCVQQPSAVHVHLLILLSGPEPQRSILEKKILLQLNSFDQPVLLIRGLPGAEVVPATPSYVMVRNHMPAEQLQDALDKASLVISRCGYSTVMDLMALRKKSILIPTPGQTEQEYLARHLMRHRLALCVPQEKFNLKTALELSASFPYQMKGEQTNSQQHSFPSLT